MSLFDLLGRRWTLRVLWELRGESLTFRRLQERCGDMSSSVLNQRLRELRDAGVVEQERGEGYGLTPEGRALLDALSPSARGQTDGARAPLPATARQA